MDQYNPKFQGEGQRHQVRPRYEEPSGSRSDDQPQAKAPKVDYESDTPGGSTAERNRNPFHGQPSPVGEQPSTSFGQQSRGDRYSSGNGSGGDGRGPRQRKGERFDVVASRPTETFSKKGEAGRSVDLRTNYFRVLTRPEWNIHQYRVDFSPEVENTRLRQVFLRQHAAKLGGFLFDGTILFTAHQLYDTNQKTSLHLQTTDRDGQEITIIVKSVGLISPADIQQLQVLNLVLRRAMNGLGLQLVGRNYYDPQGKIPIRDLKLELWPGYETSIRQHESQILLCLDIAHKVMRIETLYEILRCCSRGGNVEDDFKRQVIGETVLTDYNNKTYRIHDVDFSKTPRSLFETKKGEISFVEYYRSRYHITIRDVNQPLLVSRPTEKRMRGGNSEFVLLVPELCRPTGITEEMRKDRIKMNSLAEDTRPKPERRIELYQKFCQRMHTSQASAETLASWDMKLDRDLVRVRGRILPAITIKFGEDERFNCDDKADWTRVLRYKVQLSHQNITRWFVIVPRRKAHDARNFVNHLKNAAGGMRMHIAEPTIHELPDELTSSYAKAILMDVQHDPQILFLVLSSNNSEQYNCIKKTCCVTNPIPSQVVTGRTIDSRRNGVMSIATKVVHQMNAKLRGIPWGISLPLSYTLFVGYDISSCTANKSKAFGALVAGMNLKYSPSYYSHVSEHIKGQNISDDIAIGMTYALRRYKADYQVLPAQIVFYRDGVGDGMLNVVYETELESIKQAIAKAYQGAETKATFVFIVVSKRIKTKLFLNKENPPPGTIVDDVITLPERFDFYLISQSVRQGTVSPTNYNVLYSDSKMSADKIQQMTYMLTHLYYNWSGTCRVPAMCQYAHKLSALVAEHLHRVPSTDLERQLYFL